MSIELIKSNIDKGKFILLGVDKKGNPSYLYTDKNGIGKLHSDIDVKIGESYVEIN